MTSASDAIKSAADLCDAFGLSDLLTIQLPSLLNQHESSVFETLELAEAAMLAYDDPEVRVEHRGAAFVLTRAGFPCRSPTCLAKSLEEVIPKSACKILHVDGSTSTAAVATVSTLAPSSDPEERATIASTLLEFVKSSHHPPVSDRYWATTARSIITDFCT